MTTNNPLEILTYASLSNAAYGSGAVPMGWALLRTSPPSDIGFAAIAVRNEVTGEIVIAYRGTDGLKDFNNSNLQLALQNDVPNQYTEANAFYTAISNDYGPNITLAGHSLGGSLAQLVGAISGRRTYTFNAPGVQTIYSRLEDAQDGVTASSFTNINNYNMAFDPASMLGVQLGNSANYDPSSLEGLQIFIGIVSTTVNPGQVQNLL